MSSFILTTPQQRRDSIYQLIDYAVITKIYGKHANASLIGDYLPHLRAAAELADLSTVNRAAAFLATIAVESHYLEKIVEGVNYKKDRLEAVFPKYYKGKTITKQFVDDLGNKTERTIPLAEAHAGNGEAFANYVYDDANRSKNSRLGNTQPGDGYKFRGRGLIQMTGRGNYQALADATNQTIDQVVAWMETHAGAAISAGYFWKWRALNSEADQNRFEALTHKVNTAGEALTQRKALYNVGCQVMTKADLDRAERTVASVQDPLNWVEMWPFVGNPMGHQ